MPSIDMATGTVTVNHAFLQEIKETNQELWSVLAECRRLCGERFQSRRETANLARCLRDLCDQLALHFSLEEAYGYFDDPVSVAPRLAIQCEFLRRQHASLYVELMQIADAAEDESREADRLSSFVAIQSKFVAFDERLQDHEATEMELIQSAFMDDLGVGD